MIDRRQAASGWQWTREAPRTWGGDVAGLARALREACEGEVGFGPDRAMYSRDASNYRQMPIGYVRPRHRTDVLAAVEVCRGFGAPILPRGGGTSLAGQTVNVAVVLDLSRHMGRVLELDPGRRLARVQPGTVLDHLRDAAEEHHLTFGPDPATHGYCTLGGMIGNNACGVHALQTGRTADNVESLEVLTYGGEVLRVGATPEPELERLIEAGGPVGRIYRRLRAIRDAYGDTVRARFPKIPRRVSGYNLDELLPERGFNVARALVGSEGTCALVLEATVRLMPSPRARVLLLAGYDDVYLAASDVPEVLEHRPWGLEGLDRTLVEDNLRKDMNRKAAQQLPEGDGWLLVELGADTHRDAVLRARALQDRLRRNRHVRGTRLFEAREEQHTMWQLRESGLGATARIPGEPDTWPGWEDSAVQPERMGDYMRDLRAVLRRHGLGGAFYGHFGQGCLHTRISFELRTAHGLQAYRQFIDEASDLCLTYGGSFSGEHGDGQSRGELLPKLYGEEVCRAFEQFKATWDPDDRLNPGKVVRPYAIVSNLALGTDHRPPDPPTHFQFPDDDHRFSRAVVRCVGVGRCRKDHGVMCPSYMVTGEEKHSTRGRARLLFEMLEGDTIQDGWRSEEVKDALDLCLACKGCKSECPVNVDMATYKAEFLAHYYEGRLRPRAAYSMGLVWWWARLASIAPGVANAVASAPGLGRALKALGGISPQRPLPPFARITFRRWFLRRRPPPPRGPRVILWPDTFTNFFHLRVGQAAVEVLEAAGFEVVIPRATLCCGRPLYDYGMLGLARRLLLDILRSLSREIEAGVPVVGLEPSCVAVFRDELPQLLPGDERARRLSRQTFTLAELLGRRDDLPSLHGRPALVQPHCHHRSVLGFDADRALLDRLGLEAEVLDAGCCGMAGSFGFEAEKHEVSMACAERVLLPRVRRSGPATLVLADGFSCRTQVLHGAGRGSLHLAEAIWLALHGRDDAARATRERRSARRAADPHTMGGGP